MHALLNFCYMNQARKLGSIDLSLYIAMHLYAITLKHICIYCMPKPGDGMQCHAYHRHGKLPNYLLSNASNFKVAMSACAWC